MTSLFKKRYKIIFGIKFRVQAINGMTHVKVKVRKLPLRLI